MKAKCHKCKYCIRLNNDSWNNNWVLCNRYDEARAPIRQPTYCALYKKKEKAKCQT